MKKTALLYFMAALLITLNGCSIQVRGIDNAYKSPPNRTRTEVAILKMKAKNATLISIDGKSIQNNSHDKPMILTPGRHEVTLYVGENNYVSAVNHMIVLTAKFNINGSYYLTANGNEAWIINSLGQKVSVIVSNMYVNKSVGI